MTVSNQAVPRSKPSDLSFRRLAVLASVLLVCASTAGCSWVTPAPGAAEIRVAENEDGVAGCKQLGDISARTKSKVGIFSRSATRIDEELITLAKNEAIEMGADTILAAGPATLEGVRKYRAYQCKRS